MPFLGKFRALTRIQSNTFSACFLGWTLDAFDFFLLTFCLTAIAVTFRTGRKQVEEAIFWTLAMRPVGAFLFGSMAEKYGRRPTLIVNVVAFSVFELASAFAPTLHSFLVCRALFGVAMGGVWGVGAALALETLPAGPRLLLRPAAGRLRLRQSAGRRCCLRRSFPTFTAPACSQTGASCSWSARCPRCSAFYLNYKVEESPAWLAERGASLKQKKPNSHCPS